MDSTNFPVNLAVPDDNPVGLASTVTVSTPIQVLTNLQVTLNITNGWNGDLYAYLVHDSGFVVLLNRPGKSAARPFGYGDPGFNVTFDGGVTNNVHTYRLTLFGNEDTPLGGPLTLTWAAGWPRRGPGDRLVHQHAGYFSEFVQWVESERAVDPVHRRPGGWRCQHAG